MDSVCFAWLLVDTYGRFDPVDTRYAPTIIISGIILIQRL